MLALAICLTFIALACLFGAAYVVVYSQKEQRKIVRRALALASRTYSEACLVARSQQEAATKYVTSNAQTANLISKEIDARVRDRVKVINVKPGAVGLEAIEDAPQVPDVYQSGFVDDAAEIEREQNRKKKIDFEYDIRDRDYQAEEI